jgi:hypothetical protein
MSILPLVLIPQLLLSGFMVSIDDAYYSQTTGKPATAEQYDRFRNANISQPQSPVSPARPASTAPPDAIAKQDGLGPASYFAAIIVARWTLDALAHDVSITDTEARQRLATRMSVVGYQSVFDGKSEDEISSAYRTRVAIDFAVLALFSFVFLGLTMWALKRKDVL